MSYVTEGQSAERAARPVNGVPRQLPVRPISAAEPRSASPALPVVAVSPLPLVREGMARALEQVFGNVVVHLAGDLEAATRLHQRVPGGLFWVHEKAYPYLGFVQLFAKRRTGRGIVVLLESGAEGVDPARVTEALRAGATVVLDSASPAEILATGLRKAVRGENYISPRLRSRFTNRGDSDTTARGKVTPLTVRELQLLRLMAEGMDNRSIGEALNISVETVRTHVKSILKKLAAKNRCDAVGRAFRLGIVEPDSLPPIWPVRAAAGTSATA